MRVQDLIEILETMPEDAEVRLAIQPSHPFQHNVGEVALVDLNHEPDNDGIVRYSDEDLMALEPNEVVYIGEGGQVYEAPYLPGPASRELGWR